MFKKVKVVMLPTNEKATIALSSNKLSLKTKAIQEESQHLYFLSDEEIKEGDWFYRDTGIIYQMTKELSEYYKSIEGIDVHKSYKIIATTDKSLSQTSRTEIPQPSNSFIEKFVEEYNKGNVITEVMVEYEEIMVLKQTLNEGFGSYYHKAESEFVLKVNPKDNTITIRKVKESWNREEIISLLDKYLIDITNKDIVSHSKWIEENL